MHEISNFLPSTDQWWLLKNAGEDMFERLLRDVKLLYKIYNTI